MVKYIAWQALNPHRLQLVPLGVLGKYGIQSHHAGRLCLRFGQLACALLDAQSTRKFCDTPGGGCQFVGACCVPIDDVGRLGFVGTQRHQDAGIDVQHQ